MAPVDFAALVPYRTGRETWVATPSWSPDFGARAAAVSNLFAGRLPPAQARALVRVERRALRGRRLPDHDRSQRASLGPLVDGAPVRVRDGLRGDLPAGAASAPAST